MKRRMMWAMQMPPDTEKKEIIGELVISTTKPTTPSTRLWPENGKAVRVAVYR